MRHIPPALALLLVIGGCAYRHTEFIYDPQQVEWKHRVETGEADTTFDLFVMITNYGECNDSIDVVLAVVGPSAWSGAISAAQAELSWVHASIPGQLKTEFQGIWWGDCWWCGVYSTRYRLAVGMFRSREIPLEIDTMDVVATVACDDGDRTIELRRELRYFRERGTFIHWRRPGANTVITMTPNRRK